MSDPAFEEARVIVQACVADSSNNKFVDQCLTEAQREVARARKWPEMMVRRRFATVAAYDTGSVAVVDGDATVTLTGGTFPVNVVTDDMRFSLGISMPWYPVRTRTDGTHVELGETFKQDSDADSDFMVYKSHYSLPSDIERVEEVWLLLSSGVVQLDPASSDQHLTDFNHYVSGPGVPTHFMPIERDAHGNRQILLGPATPDDVYIVEYTARRKVIDNQFTGNLDDTRWPLIVARAKSMAYEPEFYDRSLQEMQRYRDLLKEGWGAGDEIETQSVRVGQDRVDFPMTSGMGDILSRGIVQDPP